VFTLITGLQLLEALRPASPSAPQADDYFPPSRRSVAAVNNSLRFNGFWSAPAVPDSVHSKGSSPALSSSNRGTVRGVGEVEEPKPVRGEGRGGRDRPLKRPVVCGLLCAQGLIRRLLCAL
jgi:hypothetical protein